MSSNKFQHYLPEEDEVIIKMANQGCPTWEIAIALGRTENVLYYRRAKLGVERGPFPGSKKYQRMKEAALNKTQC